MSACTAMFWIFEYKLYECLNVLPKWRVLVVWLESCFRTALWPRPAMGCGTWGGNSSTLGLRSRCGPLPALPHRGSVGKKSSSMTHNVFRLYIRVFWVVGIPVLQMLAQTKTCTICFVLFYSSHLHLWTEVSQTSCARSRKMLGCPFRVSHVFVNMPRAQTVWSPCSDTWKIRMLGCSLSSSSCLERLLSMVSKHLIHMESKYIERINKQNSTLLILCPIYLIWLNILYVWKNWS